jgi:hypothetical protein
MATSFAPSPIDSVVSLGCFILTISTISAFWLGETLHATTTLTRSVTSRNSSTSFLCFSIIVKASPATITAVFYPLSFLFCNSIRAASSISYILLPIFSWITTWNIVLSNRPAENPILIAVSILSPVKTQIIIPVSLNYFIVSGTPS